MTSSHHAPEQLRKAEWESDGSGCGFADCRVECVCRCIAMVGAGVPSAFCIQPAKSLLPCGTPLYETHKDKTGGA